MADPVSHGEITSLAREVPQGGWWSDACDWSDFEMRLAKVLGSFAGLKTDLRYDEGRIPADELAMSCVLADCTSVYLRTGMQLGADMDVAVNTDWIPESLERELRSRYSEIKYGFFFPLGAEGACKELEPLIRAGRLIVRPTPALFTTDHQGKRDHIMLEPNLPDNRLLLKYESSSQESIPVRRNGIQDEQKQLLSFGLPFIGNVAFGDLAKVLDDESDVLATFRSELRQLVEGAPVAGDELHERYNDLVRPAIETVERRFKSVVAMHSIRVSGAALSVVGVSLAALTTHGIMSSIASVLGPAGLGLVAKEVSDCFEARRELRELPFYLMWRLRRID